MIIYNDLNNLVPFPLDTAKLIEVLDAQDTVLLDENALISAEYYELEKFRKSVYETQENIKKYLDTCYEHTLLKSSNTIYFAWLVEILTYKFGLPGHNQGLEYLNIYVNKIVSVADKFDSELLVRFIKQLSWMNGKCAGILKNISLVPKELTPAYSYSDYLMVVRPGATKKLMQKGEEDIFTMERFKETIEKCSLEFLQAAIGLFTNVMNLIETLNQSLNHFTAQVEALKFEKDIFYPCQPILRDILEVYQIRVDSLLGKNEPEIEVESKPDLGAITSEQPQAATGELDSVEAAKDLIQQCITYLESSFPHTPVIMLLSAAARWLGMSFEQIIDQLMQKNASLEALYSMLSPPPPPMAPHGGFGGPPGGFGGPPGGGFPPPGGDFHPPGGGGFPPPQF